MKSKYSDLYAMMTALGSPLEVSELKELLCAGASGGRTSSLSDLTPSELSKLREQLRAQTGSKPVREDKSRKRKRSAVLKLLTDYGVDTRDWDVINAFVAQPRLAGKPFARLDNDELEALRRKLWAMLRKQKQGEQVAPPEPPAPKVKKRYRMYLLKKSSKEAIYN